MSLSGRKKLENKKISVIIPFKNRINLLIEAIKSVQFQTYSNIEIIVVDDNSTDDLNALFELIAQDNRIRYILSDRNGASAARNIGISQSSGEYIAFLDSDDLFLPEKLVTQLNYMQNTDYRISHTSYQQITQDGSPLELIDTHYIHGKIFPKIMTHCPIATPTVMAKRDLFANHCYNEKYMIGEDICLWIDISYKNEFGAIEEALTKVRVSESSAYLDKDKQYIGYFTIIKHIFDHQEYMTYKPEVCTLLTTFLNTMNNSMTIQQPSCSRVGHLKPIIKKLVPPIIFDIKKYLTKNIIDENNRYILESDRENMDLVIQQLKKYNTDYQNAKAEYLYNTQQNRRCLDKIKMALKQSKYFGLLRKIKHNINKSSL